MSCSRFGTPFGRSRNTKRMRPWNPESHGNARRVFHRPSFSGKALDLASVRTASARTAIVSERARGTCLRRRKFGTDGLLETCSGRGRLIPVGGNRLRRHSVAAGRPALAERERRSPTIRREPVMIMAGFPCGRLVRPFGRTSEFATHKNKIVARTA